MIKVVAFPHQRIFRDLNDNSKYNEILFKEKSFLLYQQGWYFEITGDPCHLVGSYRHDEHHKMDEL